MNDFDDFNDNLLDEDDALDCILFEEMRKKEGKSSRKSQICGCCVVFLVLGGAMSGIA